jgi:hypothetical protein
MTPLQSPIAPTPAVVIVRPNVTKTATSSKQHVKMKRGKLGLLARRFSLEDIRDTNVRKGHSVIRLER